MQRPMTHEKKEQLLGQTLSYREKKTVYQGRLLGTVDAQFPWVVDGLKKFEVTWDLAQASIETGLIINT